MKREIKFRAWDDGKMIYEKNILHLKNEDNHILRLAKFWSNVRNDSQIMQFTGLKDKNGVEIYEGDFVEYTLEHDSSQKIIKAEVEWYKFAWRLNRLWFLTEIRTIIIIGNIFENPEFK